MVIETERLILRRMTADDLDELVALHADPDIVRFMGPFDHEKAIDWLRRVDQNWQDRGYGRVAVTDRGTGRLLGRSGIMFLEEFQETELGWTLGRDAWGHGYATEAARACADWAFRDFQLPYLTSLIEPGNVRSISVAKRLGMSPLREDVFLDRVMVVHSLDRAQWHKQQT